LYLKEPKMTLPVTLRETAPLPLGDGSGGTTQTSVTFNVLPTYVGGLSLHAQDITGLTYTFQVSNDYGTSYHDIEAVDRTGVAIAAGGTVTCVDGTSIHFEGEDVTQVKVTRTGGSGPLLLIGTGDYGALMSARQLQVATGGSGVSTAKFAPIAVSSSGNNTLVAAVTGKKIRVLGYNLIANGSVNAKFQSGAGGTDLTGLKYLVVNSGISVGYTPTGWFETAAATLLNLNLSAAVAVGGELIYAEI